MDLTERLNLGKLFDSYGVLLSDQQRLIFDMYINNNLSLGEVAEELNISRQAVKYALDNAVNSLQTYENKLHFVTKLQDLKSRLESIKLNPTTKLIDDIVEDV